LADAEGDADAEIEEGVGHGIEKAGAVEDVGEERAEDEGGEGNTAPVAGLAGDEDGAEGGTRGSHSPGEVFFAQLEWHVELLSAGMPLRRA
jgi:hypothetical protein